MAAWCEARMLKVGVIGAGWAGCAAAVQAARLGHDVTLFEAARTPGGRARRVDITHNSTAMALDNGQHILIGAYSETLKLMADLGVNADAAMLRIPLTMKFPDGSGLQLPRWPAPVDALLGIASAKGWSWRDKAALLFAACTWQLRKFQCPAQQSVANLCCKLTPRVMATLIEPLCVSALNTPADRASAQVFLRVLRDALFSTTGGSNLLLPKVDLSALLPDAALAWLSQHGAVVKLGNRVNQLTKTGSRWQLGLASGAALVGAVGAVGAHEATRELQPAETDSFDRIILACPVNVAINLVQTTGLPCTGWLSSANKLTFEAITTVYAVGSSKPLAQPMLALPSCSNFPAQFVFDRGQLGGPAGLLAFVISASNADAQTLSKQVSAQASAQLGLSQLDIVQTIVEKRATFACTPNLDRPSQNIAPGLLAAGDYVAGPYPATLEGAIRSGLSAALLLNK